MEGLKFIYGICLVKWGFRGCGFLIETVFFGNEEVVCFRNLFVVVWMLEKRIEIYGVE